MMEIYLKPWESLDMVPTIITEDITIYLCDVDTYWHSVKVNLTAEEMKEERKRKKLLNIPIQWIEVE